MKKYIGLTIMIFALMVLLTKPRNVDFGDYFSVRYYLMGILGLVGMVVMTWQMLLGIRSISMLLTKDFFGQISLHKRLGILTFAAIIIHPIAAMIAYGSDWLFLVQRDFSSQSGIGITLGRVSLNLIFVVLITSVIVRRFMSFKVRHITHMLTYVAIYLTRIHGFWAGSNINSNPAVKTYRIVLGAIILMSTITRIANQFGIGKLKGEIKESKTLTNEIFELKIKLSKKIKFKPGQFMYIQINNFGTAHPFSIVDYDEASDTITFAIKKGGSFTNYLSTQKLGTTLFLDGPYGIFTQEIESWDNQVIAIAGGVGITPFVSLTSKYCTSKDIKLLYLNRTKSEIPYEERLNNCLDDKVFHFLSRDTIEGKNNYICQRLDYGCIEKIGGIEDIKKTLFLICGSGSLTESIIQMLLEHGVKKTNIIYEPFEY